MKNKITKGEDINEVTGKRNEVEEKGS